MNSTNQATTAALMAIRKLATDLRSLNHLGRSLSENNSSATTWDFDCLRLIDVSSLVDAISGDFNSSDWVTRLCEMQTSLERLELGQESLERSMLFYERAKSIFEMHHHSAWEKELRISLQKTANFSSCLGRKVEQVKRQDALIWYDAPIASKFTLVSIHYIASGITLEPRDILCNENDKLSSVLVFNDPEDIDSCTWGNVAGVNLRNGYWSIANSRADQNLAIKNTDAKFIVFVREVRASETTSCDEMDDFEEIPSTRARDLFYGKVKNRVVVPMGVHGRVVDLGSLNTSSGEDLIAGREAFEAWGRRCVELRESTSDAFECGDMISPQRAAALFSGRKSLLRKQFLRFYELNSKADSWFRRGK